MIKLYDYWRSSACYRLRIAFNLKGVSYESEEVSLHPDILAQQSESYKAINPQQRVPTVEIDGEIHTQSMAILNWLDTYVPQPAFLPTEPMARMRANAFAMPVACDIHPLNTSRVLAYLREHLGADQAAINAWYGTWVTRGFAALETHARQSETPFLFGEQPGLAEICLVPQIYNARRFNVDMSLFPRLQAVDAACLALEAFQRATPEAVKPA